MTALTSTVKTEQRVHILWSSLAVGLVVIVGLLVHSYNMFGFPLYLGDEGIYMSQAYAVTEMGRITPYTYWYDHAPAGWLLIAAWTTLTGGFQNFGTAIDSGRVLMLLLHLVSLVLIFRLVLRLTTNTLAATTAGLLYALSPLTITYGRMVLLDNIMIFWILLAMVLFVEHGGRIWPLLYSGICFGVAVLTKENAILLMPAFVYALWTSIERNHARFARTIWLFTAISVISFYPLYAALRKELVNLSLSTPLSGSGDSVSLFGSIIWQLKRSGGAPWEPTSDFFQLLTTNWLVADPWLLGIGLLATLWVLIRGNHLQRVTALLALLAIFSIGHGNPALDFYIVSVLPFLAVTVGLALADLATLMQSQALLPMAAVAVIAISWQNLENQRDIFTLDLTTIQRQALTWVQEHVPPEAQIVADDDLWVDLRDRSASHPGFPGVHSHWKVANDPAVFHDLFHDDWQLLDYLIMSPGLEEIFAEDEGKLTYEAYNNSTPVTSFSVGNATVEIRKVNHAGLAVEGMLDRSYNSFKDRYINDGRVVEESGYTGAQSQAIAMLMAVWMDDQNTFDDLWGWAHTHLQSESGLLYQSNEPGVEPHSLTDADTDTALALLLAEKRWRDASYGRHARRMIQAIWEHEVVEVKGRPYLAAGDWAVTEEEILFAPASFTPHAYHLFAQADPGHNWWYLLDSTYKLLGQFTKEGPEQQGPVLPPSYIVIDRDTGRMLAESAHLPASGDVFDERTAQVYWRVGLEAQWHDDERADSFLTASPFLHKQWTTKEKLAARYTSGGKPQTSKESLILYSAILPKFLAEAPPTAHELYGAKLAPAFSQKYNLGQWGEGADTAEEQWAWLATGLYANALRYQWEEETRTPDVGSYRLPVY